MPWQCTIRRAASTSGVGIHCGEHARLTLRPAPPCTGIVFVRTDLGEAIPARAENAHDLAMATSLARHGAQAGTVEHVLAALAGLGVTNAFVDLDGPEVPILDGSALPFVQMIQRVGLEEQRVSLAEIRLKTLIRVADADRSIELRPAARLTVDYRISFASAAVGEQRFAGPLTPERFATAIAPARTFGFLDEVEALRARGLGKGATLDNCVVVDGGKVVSGQLRFADEFVRHKVLDLLGDLALLEYPLRAEVVATKAGHALHVVAIQKLLETPEAWELVEPDRVAPFTVQPFRTEWDADAAAAV
jgi:UDP-3-O-[3-hydroxymyristoyl] N-acetylglucosamine deacetylase